MSAVVPAASSGDYESQGMALKLKEHDEALNRYKTYEYSCEAHLTWCCGGTLQKSEKHPYTIAAEAVRRGHTGFDSDGMCLRQAVYRLIILDREEELSKDLARHMEPTLCEQCTQIAIDERIFREIIHTKKADQMEEDYQKQMEAEKKRGPNNLIF